MALPRTRLQPGQEPEPRMVVAGRMTYDEYGQLPEDGKRYELIGGVLHVPPAPGWKHQFTVVGLIRVLADHIEVHDLGRVGVAPFEIKLTDGDVVQPDLFYVSHNRLRQLNSQRITGSPDLLVEVLSPGTRSYDLRKKRAVYEAQGIPYYWILDPLARWLDEYEWRDGEYVLLRRWRGMEICTPALFSGLQIPLAKLWEPLTLL